MARTVFFCHSEFVFSMNPGRILYSPASGIVTAPRDRSIQPGCTIDGAGSRHSRIRGILVQHRSGPHVLMSTSTQSTVAHGHGHAQPRPAQGCGGVGWSPVPLLPSLRGGSAVVWLVAWREPASARAEYSMCTEALARQRAL